MKKTAGPNQNSEGLKRSPQPEKRPYRKPTVRSTEAFEKLALQSCGQLSETAGDCDEL
jgi:hypothetical protein